MTLALFDFDGTITNKDSMIDFIKFSRDQKQVILGVIILFPIIALFYMKLLPDFVAKKYVLKYFFGGKKYADLENLANRYSDQRIDQIIRPKAAEKIDFYLKNGDKVAIVSASVELWVAPWAKKRGLDLIATKAEVIDGFFTGNLASLNCKGAEKARRIKERYDLADFAEIHAYGDTPSDREMFKIAAYSEYKPFQ
ncbi:MAG: HAD-IB family hydrolase [Helicobacteraceae bacterium]|jgi:HAD superfamily hydrolase (TIGR01490 family)|nr:HAD-IB family hydrolase [Helicobacteraceae bacterium]